MKRTMNELGCPTRLPARLVESLAARVPAFFRSFAVTSSGMVQLGLRVPDGRGWRSMACRLMLVIAALVIVAGCGGGIDYGTAGYDVAFALFDDTLRSAQKGL